MANNVPARARVTPVLPPATTAPTSPLRGDAPWRARLPWGLRAVNRLRYLAKLKQVRISGVSWRTEPAALARYLLLDPEVGDWSYPLENAEEHLLAATRMLGIADDRALAHVAELHDDEVLERDLQRRVRRRFDQKRRFPYGNRALRWVLVREHRPSFVVETGIRHGFGAAVVLRALQRNAEEGHEGTLASFDVDPVCGWIVPESLRGRWERRIGDSVAGIAGLVEAGYRIDLAMHDSAPHLLTAEVDEVVSGANPGALILCASWGRPGGELATVAAGIPGADYAAAEERPRHLLQSRAGFELIRLPTAD